MLKINAKHLEYLRFWGVRAIASARQKQAQKQHLENADSRGGGALKTLKNLLNKRRPEKHPSIRFCEAFVKFGPSGSVVEGLF